MQVIYVVGVLGRRPRIPVSCPPELRVLICDCWQRDPRARPSFAAILGRLQVRSRQAICFSHIITCKCMRMLAAPCACAAAGRHRPGPPAGMLPCFGMFAPSL